MTESQKSILIDKDLRMALYDDFHCLAANCRLSCCKNWNITFNKKDYLSLKRQEGSPNLNCRLKEAVQRVRGGFLSKRAYGEFDMSSGICPLLREDGLCALQIEKGHATLPYVCRTYPRASSYQPFGYLERSLSTSCEGVLALLWELPEGVEFRSDPLPEQEQVRLNLKNNEKWSLYAGLIREWCIDILQNRRFSLPERIMLMGMGLNRLMEEEDEAAWLPWAQSFPEQIEPGSLLDSMADEKSLKMFLMDMQEILEPKIPRGIISATIQRAGSSRIEPLDIGQLGKMTALQRAMFEVLGSKGNTVPIQPYLEARAKFDQVFKEQAYFMENLMVAIFFHMGLPDLSSPEALWKSYVNLCNLYACHRFAAVLSCREGVEDYKAELFCLVSLASRSLLHNDQNRTAIRDELFRHDSATLAHMAILLMG